MVSTRLRFRSVEVVILCYPISVPGGLLDVTPGEEVWFGSGSSGVRRTITLVNTRGAPVAFKVSRGSGGGGGGLGSSH